MIQREPDQDPTKPAAAKPFTSKEELRRRARKNVGEGAVVQNGGADRKKLIELLNVALATELVCVLRYKRHYFSAKGIVRDSVAEEFLQHANEEQGHADKLAERIVQLNGEPDMDPRKIADRAHSEYAEGRSLVDMIREDLVNERIAIESYAELIRFAQDDPTTRRLLEEILAKEEEHASEFADLLATLDPAKPTP